MEFAAITDAAREFGPVAAIALFLMWAQNRTAGRLLDAVLVEMRQLRQSSADTARSQVEALGELRGLRRELGKAEAQVEQVAGRSTAQGETLAELGVTVRDHARRLDVLERGPLPPGHG